MTADSRGMVDATELVWSFVGDANERLQVRGSSVGW
jgi:hypothetical protein